MLLTTTRLTACAVRVYATLRLRVSINAVRRFPVCTPGAACVHTTKRHTNTAVTRVLRNCFAHRRPSAAPPHKPTTTRPPGRDVTRWRRQRADSCCCIADRAYYKHTYWLLPVLPTVARAP